jgi:hypothetical protein
MLNKFDNSYPEDEHDPPVLWECARCHTKFVDPEEYSYTDVAGPFETRNHWLGPTEPICTDCAVKSGIPSIDEEYDADV